MRDHFSKKYHKRQKKRKEIKNCIPFLVLNRRGEEEEGGRRRKEREERERGGFCLLSCSRFLLPVLLASVIWGI